MALSQEQLNQTEKFRSNFYRYFLNDLKLSEEVSDYLYNNLVIPYLEKLFKADELQKQFDSLYADATNLAKKQQEAFERKKQDLQDWYNQQIAKLNKRIQKLEEQNRENFDKSQGWFTAYNELKKNYDGLQEDYNTLQQNYDALQAQSQSAPQDNHLQEKYDKLKEQNQLYIDEIHRLQDELKTKCSQKDGTIKELQEKLTQAEQKIEQVRKDAFSEGKLEGINQGVSEEKSRRRQKKYAQEMGDSLEMQSLEPMGYSAPSSRKNAGKSAELQSKLDDLQNQNNTLQSEKDDLQAKFEELQEKYEQLKANAENAPSQEDIDFLQQQLNDQKATASRLAEQQKTSSSQIESLQKEKSQLEQTISEREQEIEELKQELSGFRQEAEKQQEAERKAQEAREREKAMQSIPIEMRISTLPEEVKRYPDAQFLEGSVGLDTLLRMSTAPQGRAQIVIIDKKAYPNPCFYRNLAENGEAAARIDKLKHFFDLDKDGSPNAARYILISMSPAIIEQTGTREYRLLRKGTLKLQEK